MMVGSHPKRWATKSGRRQLASDCPLAHHPVGAFQHGPHQPVDAPGKSWRTLCRDAIPLPRAFPVASELGVQPCRRLTVAHPIAVDVRSRSQKKIAHAQPKQCQRQATAAIIERNRVCKYRWVMRFHRHLASRKWPPGTAASNATVAARSSAASGRSAHSGQMPQTEADVGLATDGVLNNSRPTFRLSVIHEEQTMQLRTRTESASSQLRAARCSKPSRAGSSGSHK